MRKMEISFIVCKFKIVKTKYSKYVFFLWNLPTFQSLHVPSDESNWCFINLIFCEALNMNYIGQNMVVITKTSANFI